MKLFSLLCLVVCLSAVGCGGASNEVKPLEGEVTAAPALETGDEEAVPQAPGLVN